MTTTYDPALCELLIAGPRSIVFESMLQYLRAVTNWCAYPDVQEAAKALPIPAQWLGLLADYCAMADQLEAARAEVAAVTVERDDAFSALDQCTCRAVDRGQGRR